MSCWRSSSISSSNALARVVVHEVVLLERLHLAREVGREHLELHALGVGEVLDDLLAALVAREAGLVDVGARCPARSWSTMSLSFSAMSS